MSNKWLFGLLLLSSGHFAQNIQHFGRCNPQSATKFELVGAASGVAFATTATEVTFNLQAVDSWAHRDYAVLVVDGAYLGRYPVEPGKSSPITLDLNPGSTHVVEVYKATEASIGQLIFDGSPLTQLQPMPASNQKRIEFIGDSITCGMGNDLAIPCHTDQWFDQHNAYYAYGPITARALKTDFLLSSVSGFGIYRNWNDENEAEPTLPQVYDNLYLNNAKKLAYQATQIPDVISICLGTNDFSDGDGKKKRLPFNDAKFISNYTQFVEKLHDKYPNAKILLLDSPMLNGDKKARLQSCLRSIQTDLKSKNISVQLFSFKEMKPRGCDYHPDMMDHQILSEELAPTLNTLLNEN